MNILPQEFIGLESKIAKFVKAVDSTDLVYNFDTDELISDIQLRYQLDNREIPDAILNSSIPGLRVMPIFGDYERAKTYWYPLMKKYANWLSMDRTPAPADIIQGFFPESNSLSVASYPRSPYNAQSLMVPPKEDQFKLLPAQVLRKIGIETPLDDLNALCRTSTTLAVLCDENNQQFWREKIRKDYPEKELDPDGPAGSGAMTWKQYYISFYGDLSSITKGLHTGQLILLGIFLSNTMNDLGDNIMYDFLSRIRPWGDHGTNEIIARFFDDIHGTSSGDMVSFLDELMINNRRHWNRYHLSSKKGVKIKVALTRNINLDNVDPIARTTIYDLIKPGVERFLQEGHDENLWQVRMSVPTINLLLLNITSRKIKDMANSQAFIKPIEKLWSENDPFIPNHYSYNTIGIKFLINVIRKLWKLTNRDRPI